MIEYATYFLLRRTSHMACRLSMTPSRLGIGRSRQEGLKLMVIRVKNK
jgi:hypothetical protein